MFGNQPFYKIYISTFWMISGQTMLHNMMIIH